MQPLNVFGAIDLYNKSVGLNQIKIKLSNRKVMKKILVMFTMMMVAMVTFAKDIKTVVFTTTPQMHCEACEVLRSSAIRLAS